MAMRAPWEVNTREKDIESYLRKEVKKIGGKAYKFISPGNAGVPDRIIVLPGGKVFFVEMKAPGKMSTPLQKKMQHELVEFGCTVFRDIDTREAVDCLMEYCRHLLRQQFDFEKVKSCISKHVCEL